MYAVLNEGTVVGVITGLPKNHGNISGFDLLTDDKAAQYGFYPMVEVKPELTELQRYGNPVDAFDGVLLTRAYPVEQKDAKDIEDGHVAALERHYDATAKQRRYDSRYTCALRAGYAGPFQAEGSAFAAWMDGCNALAYKIMSEVLADLRTCPTSAELIAEMPPMVWP